MTRTGAWVRSIGFVRLGAALLACGVVLAGCETGTFLDDANTIVGGESSADKAAREARAAAIRNKVPVASVSNVEIGRTRDGYLITAYGLAPGLGYALPALRVRRGGAPSNDGFLEFDFVATAPAEGLDLPQGNTRSRAIRADIAVREDALRRIRGIRIIAQGGGVQVPFARAAPAAPPPEADAEAPIE